MSSEKCQLLQGQALRVSARRLRLLRGKQAGERKEGSDSDGQLLLESWMADGGETTFP
jgi:hypothetical protein